MTLQLHKLTTSHSRSRRKRVGRGNAAGKGTYAGRGLKGQKSRTGGTVKAGFEGGRTSLILQTPKVRGKGFKSIKAPISPVSLDDLNVFSDGEVVTIKSLIAKNVVSYGPVKILGGGELKRKLEIKVPVSESARVKIESAGGKVTLVQKSTVEKTEKSK